MRGPDKIYSDLITTVLFSNAADNNAAADALWSGEARALRSHLREPRPNRTDTPAWSVFGAQARYDVRDSFPLLQSKRVHVPSVVGELLWMLSGSTNVHDLQKMGVTIWDEWADEQGRLGPIYGQQWRACRQHVVTEHSDDHVTVSTAFLDQMSNLLIDLMTKPTDRGHIVSAWNVAELPDMALRPCHCLFQCFVEPDPLEPARPWLDLQLYQRSADLFLGVPFNLASYALLMHMICQSVDMRPRSFIHTFGDLHIYENHLDQAVTQIGRIRRHEFGPVTLRPLPDREIGKYKMGDIVFDGYEPMTAIKAEVAV